MEHSPRIVMGLAGAGLEGALIHALQDAGATVERCLAGDALLAAVGVAPTAAVIVEDTLNRLTSAVVTELARAGAPVFVLVPASRAAEWAALGATVIAVGSAAEAIAAQVLASAQRPPAPRAQPEQRLDAVSENPSDPGAAADTMGAGSTLIAVAGAGGGVGCTTLAINLAAALGAVRDTVLVDADFAHPTIAAYLAADVLRSLAVLARDAPVSAKLGQAALEGELQRLDDRVPRARLLLGLPKPELAAVISPQLLEQALATLRLRSRYVVLDLGGGLHVADAAARCAALRADQVLLVARGDAVSLWQAQAAAARWRHEHGILEERLALVVNRHDQRLHEPLSSIGRLTRLPVAALIPEDHRQAQLAIVAQRPLVFQRRSRAARALLELADRVHGGPIDLADERPAGASRRWRPPWQRAPRRAGEEVTGGTPATVG